MSFSRQLLEIIKGTGEFMATIAFTPYGQLSLTKRPVYYVTIKRLEEKKLVQRKSRAGKVYYVITAKGKHLLRNPARKKKRTDGLSTIITFDVPEQKRKFRNILRRYLQKNGYTIIQKSVLISPYKIDRELIELLKELDLNNDVSIISGRIDHLLP